MCLTEEIIESVLSSHNQLRLLHDANPLKYSLDIGRLAQAHALKLSESGLLEHNDCVFNQLEVGENLARWRPTDTTATIDGLSSLLIHIC